jgi:hypothetical protein
MGLSETYIATATFSDGITQTGTTGWTSSNPGVATVDAAGRLEGRAHGSTTLTATYSGRTASKTVQVVNNYRGTWKGRYVIRACRDTGELADRDGGWCRAGPYRVGLVYDIRMTLVQGGNDLSDITGTLGDFGGTMTLTDC